MLPETEIQNLVRRAQDGDSAAFGQIYDLFAGRLFNFLVGKVKHKEICEDLVHTVFLKAWTNLASYTPRASAKFSTWLYQIANFTLIDYWRTRKTTVDLEDVENMAELATDQKLYENYEFLWSALSRLSLPYQTVLDLRFRQEMSVSETALIMNKSEISIRVLQHRALKALKAQLKDKS